MNKHCCPYCGCSDGPFAKFIITIVFVGFFAFAFYVTKDIADARKAREAQRHVIN